MVAGGCPGPNQMKAFVRAAMGPCQGRSYGLTMTEIVAESRSVSQQEWILPDPVADQAVDAGRAGDDG